MADKLQLTYGTRVPFFPRTYTDLTQGGYVSGLVDGEGWFMASVARRDRVFYNPKFGISMRADERPLLEWLQTYFGCGLIHAGTNRGHKNPMLTFVVANLYEIVAHVLPHFDAFPLRAKKRHDLAVWGQMVALQCTRFRQPWSPQLCDRMAALYASLKSGRRFVRPTVPEPSDLDLSSLQVEC